MRISEEYRQFGKKPANVSINEGLLREAKELGINLSAALESALEIEVRARKRAQWLEENRDALEAYNRRIEQDGIWSDGLRGF